MKISGKGSKQPNADRKHVLKLFLDLIDEQIELLLLLGILLLNALCNRNDLLLHIGCQLLVRQNHRRFRGHLFVLFQLHKLLFLPVSELLMDLGCVLREVFLVYEDWRTTF